MKLRRASRTLVLGGARSGKSYFAERLLRRHDAVDYIACGALPDSEDLEWAQRVRLHQARRPEGWTTTETLDVAGVLQRPGTPALIDCLATWLARTMDECGTWTDQAGSDARLSAELDRLVEAWRGSRRRAVLVSNEVGSSVVPATASGRRYRDELGELNARMAEVSDRVWLLTAGIPQRLR